MRARFNQRLTDYSATCLTAFLAGLALLGFADRVSAQAPSTLTSASGGDYEVTQTVERIDMIIKTSRILSLGDRIPRFQVHNEEILGATPLSENQIQIFAKNAGTTQVDLWDTDQQLYTVDITVVGDAREVEGILNTQLPLASLRVTPINESAILSGYVTSVDDVDRAMQIAEQFYTVVINNIEVVGVQQVLLHTRIYEVSRTKLRQLGVDIAFFGPKGGLLSAPSDIMDNSFGTLADDPTFINGLSGPVPFGSGSTGQATNLRININNQFEAMLKALHQQQLVKLLAEPTVVATHGRPARFIVGGRVPNVVPGGNGTVQITYEDYGTAIDFLPFVVGPGRVRLEVRPEVSEPDPTRSVTVNGLSIQAFTSRYVETAVEMQAGQTFALAGLLQSRTDSDVRRVPFLGSIPYVGTAFRSVTETKNEIELLIMITPELVDAMDPNQVPMGGPGLNSDSPDDKDFYINGHIEVPNLKGDQCDDCNPLVHQPLSPHYAPTGGLPAGMHQPYSGETLAPTYAPASSVPGTITPSSPPAPAPSGGLESGTLLPDSTTTSPSDILPPGNLAEPQASNQSSSVGSAFGRVARRLFPKRSSNSKPPESATILPSGHVVPGQQPETVGDGVTVSTPIYR